MLCANCRRNEAQVHFKSVVNGEATEWDLCAPCAKEKGIPFLGAESESPFEASPFDALSEMVAQLLEEAPASGGRPRQAPRCGHCGLTMDDFRAQGRFGCAHCYDAFCPQVETLLQRVQGHTSHTGKTYNPPDEARDAPPGGGPVKKHEIELLRKALKEAVEREAFEEAARLRDKLKRFQESAPS